MRNYDLTLILSPALSQEQANDTTQQLISSMQEEGGILSDQKLLENKPLLSPIGQHKEGHLAAIAFSLNEEKLQNLEKLCKDNEQILRFMLMKQPKKTRKGKQKNIVQQTSPIEQTAPLTEATVSTKLNSEPKKEEKIDLKDIDEKLEEIFKEA